MRHAVPPHRPSVISAKADSVWRNKAAGNHLSFSRRSLRPIYLGGRRSIKRLSACTRAAREPWTQQCDWGMRIVGPMEVEVGIDEARISTGRIGRGRKGVGVDCTADLSGGPRRPGSCRYKWGGCARSTFCQILIKVVQK